MKKIIFAGAILLFAFGANAQLSTNIYNTNGTLTSARTLTLGTYSLHFKPAAALSNGLFINASGWVGIGNTNPTQELDVNGDIKALTGTFTTAPLSGSYPTNVDRVNATLSFTAGYPVSPTTNVRSLSFMDMPVSNMDTKPAMWFSITDRGNFSRLRYRCETGGNSQFILFDKAQTENFIVSEDGLGTTVFSMPKASSFVCIGTTSYMDGSDVYKLSVTGKIRAQEVKVYNTWADYVFEDDYVLRPLEEVEQFINENGHLPNVPSAETIEEKGLELGNMMKIQQEKIEELTLYLIEQKKENDQLKKDVEELKALVKAMAEKQ